MRIHKTQPTVFKGKTEILQKQSQYIKALDNIKQAPTLFTKDIWQNIALIYWRQLNNLIKEYDIMQMFK